MKKHTLVLTILGLTLGTPWLACSREPAPKATRTAPQAAEKSGGPTFSTQPVWSHVTLQMPVSFAHLPGTSVWLANEQTGRIMRFDTANASPATVALDLKDRVRSGGERGLLGLALDPKFSENGRIFVNYTTDKPGKLTTRISSFVSKDKGQTFDPTSETVLLAFEQPYSNHNGGHIAFGPDGMLYVAVGDGGSGGDPLDHGQNPQTLLGTLLRLDVRAGTSYVSPPDNPFVAGGGRPEIFAWGLRNPWKFSFAPDGKLWAADVGQNAYEEVNVVERGKNYGWNAMEGFHCFKPASDCKPESFAAPVLEYSHKEGQSITGGYVYQGTRIPWLTGQYVFGDFVAGKIWAFHPKTLQRTLLIDTDFAIPTFVENTDGELIIVDYGSGKMFQLVATSGSEKP